MRAANLLAAAAGLAGLLVLGGCGTDDGPIWPADGSLQRETAAELARATAAQGICYGWHLDDGRAEVSGSNLGATTPVDSDPGRCPRWVQVRASVLYQPESSDADDTAIVDVRTSGDVRVGPDVRASLNRFGLDENAFLDDPAWAVSRAALALPLLTAEAGAAEPAPTPTAAPAAPRAIDPAGSDFWRDRLWFLVFAGGFFLAALLLVVLGLFGRRANRRRAAARPPAARPPWQPPAHPRSGPQFR
jgi:hypothetical protein